MWKWGSIFLAHMKSLSDCQSKIIILPHILSTHLCRQPQCNRQCYCCSSCSHAPFSESAPNSKLIKHLKAITTFALQFDGCHCMSAPFGMQFHRIKICRKKTWAWIETETEPETATATETWNSKYIKVWSCLLPTSFSETKKMWLMPKWKRNETKCWKVVENGRWQIISYHVCAFWQRDWHLPLLRFLLISFLLSCLPTCLGRDQFHLISWFREGMWKESAAHPPVCGCLTMTPFNFFWQIYPQAYDTHSQSLYRRRILKSLTCLLTFSVWRNKEKSKVHSQKDWSFGRCQTTYRKSFEATF